MFPLTRLCRILRNVLVICGIVVVLAFGWFLVHRLGATNRAVQLLELATEVPSPGEPARLVVATWNISMGRGTADGSDSWAGGTPQERAARCEKIGTFLAKAEAQIVILNEVDFDSTWSGGINMAAIIARAGGFRWRAEQRNADVVLPFLRIRTGNAVLSRFPIVSAGLLELPQPSGIVQWGTGAFDGNSEIQKRWAARTSKLKLEGLRHSARVAIALPGGKTVEVWPVHLDSRNAILRTAAAERFIELISIAPTPVILAGDFNTTVSAPEKRGSKTALDALLDSEIFITNREPHPTDRMLSFPATHPRHAIDWILVTPPLRIESLRSVASELSDHRPVLGEIVLEKGTHPKKGRKLEPFATSP